MRIAIGSDERTHLTDYALEQLKEHGHELILHGPLRDADAAWPGVAAQVSNLVASGEADQGVLFCWTGTGVSMAANKVKGIRAALCQDAQTARGARLWNNANVLCLSLRSTSPQVLREIFESWFDTEYVPNAEDDACLAELEALDSRS